MWIRASFHLSAYMTSFLVIAKGKDVGFKFSKISEVFASGKYQKSVKLAEKHAYNKT